MRKSPSEKDQISYLPARLDPMQIVASCEEADDHELHWIQRWAGRLVRRSREDNLAPRGSPELIQERSRRASGSLGRSPIVQRRLAAILFADLAGYTRLMENYESDTHQRLMTLFENVVDPTMAAADGCIVKNTGDGFLARFESVGSALECAIAIQRGTFGYEAKQPPERRLAFRMGLHVADIVIEARDIYGSGVNLAARLQQLAEPGTITISASVREQFGGRLLLAITDLGYVKLKNISTPVRVFRVLPLLEAEHRQSRLVETACHLAPAIALPPFVECGQIQTTVAWPRYSRRCRPGASQQL